jgi:predicted ATPase
MKQAAFSFQKAKVPLPGHLLDYAEIYVKATTEIESYDLGFLKAGTTYRNINGTDKIFFNDEQSINLTDSASGFQSVVPLLLPIVNEKKFSFFHNNHYSFVIEEPETNLFPKAQYELLKFLEKDRYDDTGKIDQGIIHTYTTHSPFVLTALNNMLYAYKKGNVATEKVKENISAIIPKENWINPDFFSAFEINNGNAIDIFNRETGLFKENSIDNISDEIMEDFRDIALASIDNE